jgi:chromosome segregation ATPase
MQIKSIAMLAVAGCAIGMLTGCGVPQDEHDAIVAQLNAEAQASEDALNAKLAETEADLTAELAKTSKLEVEIQDTVARMDELKLAAEEAGELLVAEQEKVTQLKADLAAVTATVDASHQQALDAENERDLMEMEKIETQRRFDMLRAALLDLNNKNPDDLQIKLIVDDMNGVAPSAATATESAPAASDTDSVIGLLDEMDSM